MAESRALKDLLEFTRDGEWGKGEPADGLVEIAVIRGTDFPSVRRGDVSTVPRRFISNTASDRKSLEPGDLLIETAGGTKDQPTGRTVYLSERIFNTLPVPVTCASFSRFLRVKREVVNPKYLFWYLQSIYSTGQMLPYHIQHTGVARFQYTDFASQWQVPLPFLEEQAEIADTLSLFDDKIELNRRMNETLEAMARAIFKDWFIDFGPTRAKAAGRAPYLAPELWDLFPDALDDQDKPNRWRHWTLAELATLHRETISPATDPERIFEHYSIPAYDAGQEPRLDPGSSIKSNKTIVPSDAILLSKLNPDIPRVWIPNPLDARPQIASTEFLAFTPKAPATGSVLYCLFGDANFRREMEAMVTGTSKSHQRVSPKALVQRRILYGTAGVFEKFDRQVSGLLSRVLRARAESLTLAQTRDLLLPKLMSGEICLAEAEKRLEAIA